MNRRNLLRSAVAIAIFGVATTSFADTYPGKPVTIVIPFPPGPGLDLVARMVGDKLSGIVSMGDLVKARIDELETNRAYLQSYIGAG